MSKNDLDTPVTQHKQIKKMVSSYNKTTEKSIKQALSRKNVKKFQTLRSLLENLEK
jgi:hypothetical protein